MVHNHEQIEEYKEMFNENGYEGIIIRNANGKYLMGHRSNDLLKYKDFVDDEFLVVGAKTGVGRFSDCVIWVCKTQDGKTFDVNHKCSMEKRKKYFQVRHNYIGRMLTVRYQNLSKDGLPIFPVGIDFRDYE
jgi:ATP-dependent DNA ligase